MSGEDFKMQGDGRQRFHSEIQAKASAGKVGGQELPDLTGEIDGLVSHVYMNRLGHR